MFRIGCHISSAGGYLAMAKRAEALGANTFAFFTRNPRGGSAKPIEETDIAAFHAECARAGIDRLVAHAPYTLNPCAAKANVAEFARMAFSDDVQRPEQPAQTPDTPATPGKPDDSAAPAGSEISISEALSRVLQELGISLPDIRDVNVQRVQVSGRDAYHITFTANGKPYSFYVGTHDGDLF